MVGFKYQSAAQSPGKTVIFLVKLCFHGFGSLNFKYKINHVFFLHIALHFEGDLICIKK